MRANVCFTKTERVRRYRKKDIIYGKDLCELPNLIRVTALFI